MRIYALVWLLTGVVTAQYGESFMLAERDGKLKNQQALMYELTSGFP